jgi:pyridoxal phosphate enzyme (YggS family)
MVGNLQSNKAKKAAQIFDMVQSIDSIRLSDALDSACGKLGKSMEVLVEVNIGEECSKAGIEKEGLMNLLSHFGELSNLTCSGIMVIPPVIGAASFFPLARKMFESAGEQEFPNVRMKILSMGMSADFEEAILQGATMVRLGRAIFGER